MSEQINFYNTIYNPDVLSCIANLSNDEVFTPPDVANAMLDMLPQELFSDPNTKFLDPACKSGVFLREIAKRLLIGLEPIIPDLQDRIDHIFHKQLYGIAITELTSLLARRSLYCSKYPNSVYSVSKFDDVQGNIRFKNTQHRWSGGKCVFCGASESEYGSQKREGLETHAYEFIHTTKPQEIMKMKFDVIIGNPPYQLNTNGAGKQAKPIYHLFVRQAKKLTPSYLVMITPSRWLAGGMGLDDYRDEMLNDGHIRAMVDYSLSTDCFPGVDVAGGVSYFVWDKDYKGECKYTYIDNGNRITCYRKLNEYEVFVRNNLAIEIVKKVMKNTTDNIGSMMSSLGPFGLGTAERGIEKRNENCYVLMSSAGRSYIKKENVLTGYQYIDKWKVVIGKATSAGAATAGKDGMRKVIATLELLEPGAVCTFSYFVAGAFDNQQVAINYKKYISTKFVRFLLLQTLSSINISKERFRFVPIQDFNKEWTDEELFAKYDLSKDEVDLIEHMIKPMDINGGDDNA